MGQCCAEAEKDMDTHTKAVKRTGGEKINKDELLLQLQINK